MRILLPFLALLPGLLLAQDIKVIKMDVNDMVYVPQQDRIYVTTGNAYAQPERGQFCMIDPYYGTIDTCYFVGPEPDAVAASADGKYVYVGVNNAAKIVRFNIQSQKVDQEINLGFDEFNGFYFAEDIAVLPNTNTSIAVARAYLNLSPRHAGVAIFDNGQMRPVTTQVHTGSNSLAFGQSARYLFGHNNETSEFGIRTLEIANDGAREIEVVPSAVYQYYDRLFAFSDRLYTNSGQAFAIQGNGSLSFLGRYTSPNPGETWAGAVGTDTTLFYLASHSRLYTFNRQTLQHLDEMTISQTDQVAYTPLQMISWGNGGLALQRGDSYFGKTELVIIRACTPDPSVQPRLDYTSTIGGCFGDTVKVRAPAGYRGYFWSNGYTGPELKLTDSGPVSLRVTDGSGCLSSPSNAVMVQFEHRPSSPQIGANVDLRICRGQKITIYGNGSDNRHLWSTGDTTFNLVTTQPGSYSLRLISPFGCVSEPSNTLTVTQRPDSVPPLPVIAVQGDTLACEGDPPVLLAPAGYTEYLWSTGYDYNSTYIPSVSGDYAVQVRNAAGCWSEFSRPVHVEMRYRPYPPYVTSSGPFLVSNISTGNQWFHNGNPIPGATGQFHTATESGFYSAQVTIDGCTSEMSNLQSVIITAVAENEEPGEVRLYPVPVTDWLTAELPAGVNPGKLAPVAVYGLDGRRQPVTDVQMAADEKQVRLRLSHLPAGMYILQLSEKDGRVLTRQKVVKQ